MQLQQLEEHVDNVNLDDMKEGGKDFFTPAQVKAAPAEVLSKVCSIYLKVKPIIATLSELFFLPAKWRAIIKTFMASMDNICPGL